MRHTPSVCTKKKIYLDANFLIPYFCRNHGDHSDAVRKFASLLKNFDLLLLSNLGLDETYFKIVGILEGKSASNVSFRPYEQQLRSVLNQILNEKSRFRVIQFSSAEEGATLALSNIKNYDLKPRDAYHLAVMQNHEILDVVTKDKDFSSVLNITTHSF